jgi:hypothetical protein
VHTCTERNEIRASCISELHSQNDDRAVGKYKKSNNDEHLGGCAVAGEDVRSNGGDEPGLSDYRIRQLAGWYLERAEADRQGTGTIWNKELDDALRAALAQEGVFPEFIGVEFDRVIAAVFKS